MTKQEAIKLAYGLYFYKHNKQIDENGWIDVSVFKEMGDYGEVFLRGRNEFDDNGLCRPMSLNGIEHNNGWVKIESAEDLPKRNGVYLTIRGNGLMIKEQFYVNYPKPWLDLLKITHWLPIKRQLKPIY